MEILVLSMDITKVEADAIVNAANSSLLGGGGVDGAIHKVGGRKILEECIRIREKIGTCKTGEVVKTNAGELKAKHVFHAVGPVWQDGNHNEKELLRKCYENILEIAENNHCGSIAIPNISTGIYGFPKDTALEIVNSVINKSLERRYLKKVMFITYDKENYKMYKRIYG